jgi:molybdopterin molybdotransferase
MELISFQNAYDQVLGKSSVLGVEYVPFQQSSGRILALGIRADRNLPPFDRATMDGIAIRYSALEHGISTFPIVGEARAGSPQRELQDETTCLEVMTGAIVPSGADTVIRYEDLSIEAGQAKITGEVQPGQAIHREGSDAVKGKVLLAEGTMIGPAEIAVLASVGCTSVPVCRAPRTTVVSTGDELVEISQNPLPHQIRRSNVYALVSALKILGIEAQMEHLPDQRDKIYQNLSRILASTEVLILSGGVSMGKYDFLPEVFEQLGVKKSFHRVAQRPGKPFWFGIQPDSGCRVFSFPGNPVSTFLNYHLYFRNWLFKSWNFKVSMPMLPLSLPLNNSSGLTQFHLGKVVIKDGNTEVVPVAMNSSGDFVSLSDADGFIRLDPGKGRFEAGTLCPFLSYKSIKS